MTTNTPISLPISLIEAKIGYTFKDKTLLSLAFVHRSFINENKNFSTHNERLEFLGDSVLNMLIADYLYRYLPSTPEGELSQLRSRLVEANSCYIFANKYDLGQYLLLGKGEKLNDGRGRESILADLFEAVIAAIYLDGGIEAARRFLFKNFSLEIDALLKKPLSNFKALLQDHCQKIHQQTPIYQVLEETGPDHSKQFKIAVLLQEKAIGEGFGNSKKEAQQAAAFDALKQLNVLKEDSTLGH